MSAPTVLAASRSSLVANTLRALLEEVSAVLSLPHQIETFTYTHADHLIDRLACTDPEILRNSIVCLDLDPESCNAWDFRFDNTEAGLATRLLLALPEVYFIFLFTGSLRSLDRFPERVESFHFVRHAEVGRLKMLLRRHAAGLRVMFDPLGLRAYLKCCLAVNADEPEAKPKDIYFLLTQSRRDHVAAVADEEPGFVYANAYAAYRAGYRCWLLSSCREFWSVLPERAVVSNNPIQAAGTVSRIETEEIAHDTETAGPSQRADMTEPLARPSHINLILTDWELTYADLRDGTEVHLLRNVDLESLDDSLSSGLTNVVIFSGFDDPEQRDLVRRRGFRMDKPGGGLFALLTHRDRLFGGYNPIYQRFSDSWSNIVVNRRWRRALRSSPVTYFRNLVRERVGRRLLSAIASKGSGHSAPYAHLELANSLLKRARCLLASVRPSTESMVHAALLATEAKEILGGLSKTTSYEAIAVEHEAEVLSETMFFGAAAQIDSKKRLEILECETEAVCYFGAEEADWPARSSRRAQQNCLMLTVDIIRTHLTESDQVEASEQCVRLFAKCQRKLRGWSFLHYPELITGAGTQPLWLLWWSFVWVLVFAFLYFGLLEVEVAVRPVPIPQWPEGVLPRVIEAFVHSGLTFVQIGAGLPTVHRVFTTSLDSGYTSPLRSTYLMIYTFELTLAWLHFALLASILYRRVTRRAP